MTLEEFIHESLRQISNGVAKARSENPKIAMPVEALGKAEASCTLTDGQAGFLVDFDVAITVSEKASTEMGGGILIASLFKAGATKSGGSEQSSISRIRFCVPIIFT